MGKNTYQPNQLSNMVCGNSIDIKIPTRDITEIRADVVMQCSIQEKFCDVVRIWGQVLDCNKKPIAHALLKLVKVVCTNEGKKYEGIAHGVSDCNGFYQFDVYYCEGNEYYKILVSRMYVDQDKGCVSPVPYKNENETRCMDERKCTKESKRECMNYPIEPITYENYQCMCEAPKACR